MTEQQILDALALNDLKTIRALREKDDAMLAVYEEEAQRLRAMLHLIRGV